MPVAGLPGRSGAFVPNDIVLGGPSAPSFIVLTGPNMGESLITGTPSSLCVLLCVLLCVCVCVCVCMCGVCMSCAPKRLSYCQPRGFNDARTHTSTLMHKHSFSAGGKSTLLRQSCLAALLAQVCVFVCVGGGGGGGCRLAAEWAGRLTLGDRAHLGDPTCVLKWGMLVRQLQQDLLCVCVCVCVCVRCLWL